MWTFDRYQRWMEQKTDWLRAPLVRSPPTEDTVKVASVPKTPAAPPKARTATAAPKRATGEQQPEIIDDLDEIVELARKIEERTR